jgi:hypothetical protein
VVFTKLGVKPAFAEATAGESGSSSVGRATASQAVGREFETRFPLFFVFVNCLNEIDGV